MQSWILEQHASFEIKYDEQAFIATTTTNYQDGVRTTNQVRIPLDSKTVEVLIEELIEYQRKGLRDLLAKTEPEKNQWKRFSANGKDYRVKQYGNQMFIQIRNEKGQWTYFRSRTIGLPVSGILAAAADSLDL